MHFGPEWADRHERVQSRRALARVTAAPRTRAPCRRPVPCRRAALVRGAGV